MDSVGALNNFSPVLESAKTVPPAAPKYQPLGANERIGTAVIAGLVGVTTFFGLLLTGAEPLSAAIVSLWVGIAVFSVLASTIVKTIKAVSKAEEATSKVETQTEEKIQAAINELNINLEKAKKFIISSNKRRDEALQSYGQTINVTEKQKTNDIFDMRESFFKSFVEQAFKSLLENIPSERKEKVLEPYQEKYGDFIQRAATQLHDANSEKIKTQQCEKTIEQEEASRRIDEEKLQAERVAQPKKNLDDAIQSLDQELSQLDKNIKEMENQITANLKDQALFLDESEQKYHSICQKKIDECRKKIDEYTRLKQVFWENYLRLLRGLFK